MRTHFSPIKALAAITCTALALTSSPLWAELTQQQTDDIIRRYVMAARALTSALGNIRDADRAQRTAIELEPLIETLNPLVQQMKSVYGNAASQTLLKDRSEELTRVQADLQREQVRLLTADCALAPTARSLNSNTPVQIKLINRTQKPITFHWVNYQGQSSPASGPIQPGQFHPGNSFASHVFTATDSAGGCVGLVQISRAGSYEFVGSLAPTVGAFLAKLVR